jgi:hypothetical protein
MNDVVWPSLKILCTSLVGNFRTSAVFDILNGNSNHCCHTDYRCHRSCRSRSFMLAKESTVNRHMSSFACHVDLSLDLNIGTCNWLRTSIRTMTRPWTMFALRLATKKTRPTKFNSNDNREQTKSCMSYEMLFER